MSSKPWLGRDESGGVPSQLRPDRKPPPHWRLDAIYATERPHHAVLSPDGTTAAFVLSSGADSDIWLVGVAGGAPRRLTTDRSLAAYWEDSAPCWSPDGSRLAYSSSGGTWVVNADGGPPKRLCDGAPGTWLDGERMVVIVERDRCTRLAVIDVGDPWPQPFGPSDGDVSQVVPTGDGRVLAVFHPKDDFNRSDVIVADPAGTWLTLAGHADRRAGDPAAGDGIVAYTLEDGEWRAVYLTDLDGSDHRILAKTDADFGSLSWSGDGQAIAAVRTARGQADLVTISLDGETRLVAEGGSWQSPGWAGEEIVAVDESHTYPSRLVTVGDEQRTLYEGVPAAVAAAPHARFDRVSFESLDGTTIEGFLFTPRIADEPVPAVVYPHGGPTSVYGDEWDGHAQYFVDKGYAWLAINFRGSTTYGLSFERANHDDWGVGDTEDCIAAGRYLAGLDWVDADRIAIFGASYGSYMALASLVHPDNPFACGVAKYGDCDILTSWAQGDRVGGEDLERMMGHPSTNRAAYRAGSPIHDVDNLERPILVAHGEKDARVHVKQAEELVAELRRLDKPYEYVTYPEEAHGFLRKDSQLDFYRRLERFLDWHLM